MNDSIFLRYKQTSDRRQQKPKAAVKEKSVTVRESKRDLALARQGLPGTKSNLRDIGGLLVPGWLCICVSREHPDGCSPPRRWGLWLERHFLFFQILSVRKKMKTAPQIRAPLIIHQSILLNKHDRLLLPRKGQKPTWDSDSGKKNRSPPSMLSTVSAIHEEKIALHLEADSGCTHTSQNIHTYIYTEMESVYTHLHRDKHISVRTVSRQKAAFLTPIYKFSKGLIWPLSICKKSTGA